MCRENNIKADACNAAACSAAAVRKGVLLCAAGLCAACAAVGVCVMRCDALRVRLQKEQKFAQLVECKRHESRPWQIEMQLLRCVRADLCLRKG